jgi:hypothetical protein
LFAFSLIDADCFLIQYCDASCLSSNGADACAVLPSVLLTVIDIDGTRKTTYNNMLIYNSANVSGWVGKSSLVLHEPPQSTSSALSEFAHCSSIRNPLFGLAPVCVLLCSDSIDRAFSADVLTVRSVSV